MHLFLVHNFFDVFFWAHPDWLTFSKVIETWWKVELTNTINSLLLSKL